MNQYEFGFHLIATKNNICLYTIPEFSDINRFLFYEEDDYPPRFLGMLSSITNNTYDKIYFNLVYFSDYFDIIENLSSVFNWGDYLETAMHTCVNDDIIPKIYRKINEIRDYEILPDGFCMSFEKTRIIRRLAVRFEDQNLNNVVKGINYSNRKKKSPFDNKLLEIFNQIKNLQELILLKDINTTA